MGRRRKKVTQPDIVTQPDRPAESKPGPVEASFYLRGDFDSVRAYDIGELLRDYLGLSVEEMYDVTCCSHTDRVQSLRYNTCKIKVYEPPRWESGEKEYRIVIKLNSASLIPQGKSSDEFARLVEREYRKQSPG
jgi:hypothetical protein